MLGPSHVAHLDHCAATTYSRYDTPLGGLDVDTDVVDELCGQHGVEPLDVRADGREHSLELHMPYIRTLLDRSSSTAKIVPLVVGISTQNAGYLDTKRDRMGHQLPAHLEAGAHN